MSATPCHTGRVRKLLIGLVILAALLVAADFGARAYAESRAATAVQAELRMVTTPDVSIEGFPFLWHAATGEYPQVIVTARRVDNAEIPGIRAVASLAQVALPPGDLINQDTSGLTAQSTRLQALIPLSSLAAALGQPGLTLSAAADGSVAVAATVPLLGQQVPLTGTALVTVRDETLTISIRSLAAAGLDVPPALTAAADAFAGGLSRSFQLTGLPVRITTADVTVEGSDVVVTATTGPVALADLQ